MSIKININWDFISPLLGKASGIVKIDEVSCKNGFKHKKILECKCFIERGQTGFKELNVNSGVPTKIFNLFEEQIRDLMKAYFDGLLLRKSTFQWIQNKSLEELRDYQRKAYPEKYKRGEI